MSLSGYAGQWMALRDGHVVATNIDAVALRNDPEVRSTDDLMQVPLGGTPVLILQTRAAPVPSLTLAGRYPYR